MREEGTGRPEASIDIVVPIYNAPDDLRRCVEAVLAHDHRDCRLVLLDDASPDPGIARYFAELAARRLPQVLLLANERNLGFTGNANRGMQLSRADVILLNSDTIVTAGWIEALRHCAATNPAIGTITPFSNNAEICSFPRFCVNNRWPVDDDPAPVAAALAAAAVPTYPDLPTGVGFCLFVRRALIDDIGVFDTAFGAGYGEENDFCLRAARRGWRNVLADNAFVLHTGERSFDGRKAELSRRNTTLLLERHPHYTRMVEGYIAADPLAPLRAAAATRFAADASGLPGVLHVIHHHGGGTETHVRALIGATRDTWRHHLAIAVDDHWQVETHYPDGSVLSCDWRRAPGESWRDFLGGLCRAFGIGLVHVHNLSACRDGVLEALADFPLRYGYTVHDLNFACPTITFLGQDGLYCGGVTDAAACARCLAAQPAYEGVDIAAWRARHRAFVVRAAFVIAPSAWAATMLERYFPGRNATVIPHGVSPPVHVAGRLRTGVLLPDDGLPTVVVLGAVGPDKGARRLERLVALARERNAPLRFVLIGYLDVQHAPWQSEDARFTVHGHYAAEDLPDLLAHYRAALVLYPSAGPETFSYTLSEAWSAGYPALVPPIGALAERVAAGGGFVLTEAEWRDEAAMLARIVAVLAPEAAADRAAAARAARAMPTTTLAAMAVATLAEYGPVLAPRAALEVFRMPPAQRLRDAFGYKAWQPPEPAPAAPSAAGASAVPATIAPSPSLLARFARGALSIRHTAFGRFLYRLAPQPLLDLLKDRLKA